MREKERLTAWLAESETESELSVGIVRDGFHMSDDEYYRGLTAAASEGFIFSARLVISEFQSLKTRDSIFLFLNRRLFRIFSYEMFSRVMEERKKDNESDLCSGKL